MGYILCSLLLLIPTMTGHALERLELYGLPPSLDLGLQIASPTTGSLPAEGTGRLVARIGRLSGLEIRLAASRDLVVEPASVKADELASGATQDIPFTIRPGPGKAGRFGTWIRLHVAYLPDYPCLLEMVARDTARYPDPERRGRLLEAVKADQKAARKIRAVVEMLVPTAGSSGKPRQEEQR